MAQREEAVPAPAFARDRLDATTDQLMRQDPPVQVLTLGDSGLRVPVPPVMPVRGVRMLGDATSALELVVPDDVRVVVETWQEARGRGAASAVVHLVHAPDEAVQLHMIDQRHRWGVYVAVLVGAAPVTAAEQRGTDLLRPRVAYLTKDAVGVITGSDRALGRMLGWEPAQVVGRRSLDLVHLDDQPKAIATWMGMLAHPGEPRRVRVRHLRADGGWHWVEITNENLLHHPDHGVVRCEVVDVSEEMAATEQLRTRERLLATLAQALPIGCVRLDAAREVAFRNDLADLLVGRPVTRLDVLLQRVGTPQALLAAVQAAEDGTDLDLSVVLHRGDEQRHLAVSVRGVPGEGDGPPGVLLCLTDTTEATRLREELSREARHDRLTGCLRRGVALDEVEALLGRLGDPTRPAPSGTAADDDPGSVAVLFVDLDGFKAVNDRRGHAAGDRLLAAVGERLRGLAGPADLVGRLGGDEFLLVLPGLAAEAVDDAVRRVGHVLLAPVEVDGEAVVPHASVGSAWTDVPVPADTLVAHADASMYRAKRQRPDRRRPV